MEGFTLDSLLGEVSSISWHVLLGENLSILNTIIILEHNQLTNLSRTLSALEIL
jgi:hypothetical protein